MIAMILAAGLGTRLKPFTDKHPKALAPVGDFTLLEIAIKKLLQYGITDIYINVHHFADQIINYLKFNENFGANIFISDEQNEILETGGGLQKMIFDFNINEPILVINADILSSINYNDLINYHLQHNGLVTLAIQDRDSSRKLIFDQNYRLKAWTNTIEHSYKPHSYIPQPIHNKYAFSGIQIVDSKLLNKTKLTGKFSLIDLYLDTMLDNDIYGYNHSGDILLDVGKPEAHQKAQLLINEIIK